MTAKRKKELITLILGAALLAGAYLLERLLPPRPWYITLIIYLVPYALVGSRVVFNAVHGLIGRQFLDENFLMTAASIGALAVGEHIEAVLVMLLYRLGELLQSIAVGKSRDSVAALMDICPESVNLETDSGFETVAPDDAHIGDVFIVRPGERIPLDGVVIEGSSELNTAALTGESLPVAASAGDRVSSGCINVSGVLRIRSECEYENSTVMRMLELIEGAAANKAKSEKFITKFAKLYTPIVVALALLLAVLPPLFAGESWNDWIYRALNFLVISCPCALVISVPLTFFGGIGGASRSGILIKGSNSLEALAKCGTVVFDKTGTLTVGSFRIIKLVPQSGVTENELLAYTAAAERLSTHPLAVCVVKACDENSDAAKLYADDMREIAGRGVEATVDGHTVYAGNHALMSSIGIDCEAQSSTGTVIFAAIDGKYIGHIEIADDVKTGAEASIAELRERIGVKTVMLTGDRRAIGETIANALSLDEVHSELTPQGKVEQFERLKNEAQKGRTVAFVGDGINDAPVIARADVGFAMGGLGSDAAIEAADIVIMDDRVEKLPLAIRTARRTVRIATENIIFALAVKLIVLAFGALGYAEMWMAIAADVGVCLIAILNAMRAMRVKQHIRSAKQNHASANEQRSYNV